MRILRNLITGVALAGLSSTVAFAETTLRFASFEPPVAFLTKNVFTPWAEQVSAASGGTIKVKMFPGGTLGRSPAQQLKLVEDGVADIGWVIPGYTPGRFDEGTVGELPFLVQSSEAGSNAMWKLYEDGLLQGDYKKFKMIGIFTSYPNFVVSTKPVVKPSDMSGLSFRAPGPTLLSALEALGSVPVGGITGPTIAESMSRGLIDGTLSQWGAVSTFRIGEVAEHYLQAPLGATAMLVVMNKDKYDSLPDEAKAAIDAHSGGDFSDLFGKAFDSNVEASGVKEMARDGITVNAAEGELLEEWRAAVSVATEEWIASTENGQTIHDAFKAALSEYPGAF
ncbi:TRAP-type C4-dicarboxylate transport system, substrate-binding protein [Shimia gijangensis]|uniref:TRAP-type C4-dicarboxylate transport system, substrate-binding protein n=1 Tax=Shimia gijangensis TaxID=1470563 RepID=A0A1M6SUA2_9RHOB|nr:TRAP transporter substrate-binding protein [Shimia gijangensis]SHK48210.1 TRAP-type C4-dicarboxylate transport system, substrate-binding protein [Shimia gijangensis]